MKDEQTRYKHYMPDYCSAGTKSGPQSIIVRQVLGEREKQKVLDIHVRVPEKKPAIEQIVDVFVKDLEINSVDVICDRVIVRGEFEIKAIYVACLPGNPVHAVEVKHCKWTQDIDIPGARPGMDAEANVKVEFVDYEVAEMTRAYKYKYHGKYDPCDTGNDCSCSCESDPCDTKDSEECTCPPQKPKPPHKPMPPFKPPMSPPCNDLPLCPENPCPPVCEPVCPPHKPMPPFKPPCAEPCPPCPPVCHEEICCRHFDVAVILKVTAKVITDREVQMQQAKPPMNTGLPDKPKG